MKHKSECLIFCSGTRPWISGLRSRNATWPYPKGQI